MSVIKIKDISHVRFSAPDLSQMAAFLADFGIATVEQDGDLYGRGEAGRPYLHVTEPGEAAFRALGLVADSVEDLEKLAKAEGVEVANNPAPGGGKIVELTDPDGFTVEVVAGQSEAQAKPGFADRDVNTAHRRARQGTRLTFDAGPSHVQRLGHCVLNVADFAASERWYKDRFGFLTSDEIEAEPGQPVGAFLRCDRGAEPTDHHTLFLAQGPGEPRYLHAAFEVVNFDDLMLGHMHLKKAGHRAEWGIGRHIMGSQIFDYWLDPFGNEVEHWTDGDLLNADSPPAKGTMMELLGVQWGPPHPMMAGADPNA